MQETNEIEYPCLWQYKIIGQDKNALEEAAPRILTDKTYSIAYSKKSSGGKYHSYTLETEVADEKSRNDIYSSLKKQPGIRMVI